MKIYTIVVCIGILVTKDTSADDIIRPIKCPITTSDLECKTDQHPGQVIDDNGCLVWICVPNQPSCCPPSSLETIKCTNVTHLVEVIDPKTGCLSWICVPNQPICCPIRSIDDIKCIDGSDPVEVTDPKTGCLIFACVQPPCCPRLSFVSIFCEKGSPALFLGRDGCAYWGCTDDLSEIGTLAK